MLGENGAVGRAHRRSSGTCNRRPRWCGSWRCRRGKLGSDGVDRRIDRRRAHQRELPDGDCAGLASLSLDAVAEGSCDILLDQALDRWSLRHAPLPRRGSAASRTPLKPRRCCLPGRPRAFRSAWVVGGGVGRDGLPARLNAVPELLFGLEQLELVEPVAGDLDDLIFVIAEDHREHRPLCSCHRHIVLQLGHIALEHFFRLGKGAGVLGLPHRAARLDHAIKRAAPPVRSRTGDTLPPTLLDPLTRQPLEPLAVEGLGPAPEHDREDRRQDPPARLRRASRATTAGSAQHRPTG